MLSDYTIVAILSMMRIVYTNPVTNGCGTLRYTEPAIAGRNVTVSFDPRLPTISSEIIWWMASEKTWMRITETWKFRLMDEKLVIESESNDRSFTIYVQYGSCRSEPLRISLEVLTDCGKLYQRTHNVRLGGFMELGYFPSAGILINPNLYVRIFRVKKDTCEDTNGCLITNTTGLYQFVSLENHEYVLRMTLTYAVNGDYLVQCTEGREVNVFTDTVQIRAPVRPNDPNIVGTKNITHDCIDCLFSTEGVWLPVKCNVTGGTLPLDVKIFINGTEKQTTLESGLYQTVSQKVTKEHHNANVRCIVNNLALVEPLVVTSKIYVAVRPNVAAVVPSDMRADNVSTFAYCSSMGGRPAGQLTLSVVDGNSVIYTNSVPTDEMRPETKLSLVEVNRTLNGKNLKCLFTQPLAEFSIGSDKRLLFKFSPESVSITSNQQFSEILPSYIYIITCTVANTYPACNVSWSFPSKSVMATTSGRYVQTTVSTASFDVSRSDFGTQVSCSSLCTGTDPMTSTSHLIKFPYPPDVSLNVTTETAVNVTEGDTIVVKCTVDSYPSPVVQWLDDTNVVLTTSYSCGDHAHCLKLEQVTANQTGLYKCTAKNELSNEVIKNITVHVQAHQSTDPRDQKSPEDPSSLMFAAIGTGILIILIIIIIVIIVVRRRPVKQKEPIGGHPEVEEINNGENQQNTGVVEEAEVTYAVVTRPANRQPPASKENGTDRGSKKELIYADLDLVTPPNTSRGTPTIIGTSDTEYVQIDFTKKATPLPDSDPSEEDNIYMN